MITVVLKRLLEQRHNYYRALLVIEVLVLISLSSLQRAPQLVGVTYVVISGVGVLLDSPLLPKHRLLPADVGTLTTRLRHRVSRVLLRRRLMVVGWLSCLVMEVLWQSALVLSPALAVQLSAPHLVIWLLLLLFLLWGLVNALAEEPVFNGSVLMGAAAGYLLVGFAGGIVLNSLLVLEPAAFALPHQHSDLPAAVAHAPTVLGAAFGCLTTLGTPVLKLDHLAVQTAAVAIAVVGQLYIAILIAGVLGKPRQLAVLRKAQLRRTPMAGTRSSRRPRRPRLS
jgi:hypothetical protein